MLAWGNHPIDQFDEIGWLRRGGLAPVRQATIELKYAVETLKYSSAIPSTYRARRNFGRKLRLRINMTIDSFGGRSASAGAAPSAGGEDRDGRRHASRVAWRDRKV